MDEMKKVEVQSTAELPGTVQLPVQEPTNHTAEVKPPETLEPEPIARQSSVPPVPASLRTETIAPESLPVEAQPAAESIKNTMENNEAGGAVVEGSVSKSVQPTHPEPASVAPESKSESVAPEVAQRAQDTPALDTPMENTPAAPDSATVKTEVHPAPEPVQEHTPAKEATGTPSQPVDQEMPDAPNAEAAPKLSRERDPDPTDPSEEPAAKRTKVEGEEPASDFKVPDLPTPATEAPVATPAVETPAGETPAAPMTSVVETPAAPVTPAVETPAAPPDFNAPITKLQQKYLMKCMQALRRMPTGRFYKDPVDAVKMGIPNYPNVIHNPMDVSTIDKKLRTNAYLAAQGVIDDFQLMIDNAAKFNGFEHLVAKEGRQLQETFNKQMENLPKPGEVEEKKPKKAPQQTSAGRREPRAGAGQNTSRQSAGSPQGTTFPLGPDGLPLIRRDSSTTDGRPKRSIHPPKRDLEYSTKPKKKKYQAELKFCQDAMNELYKQKYSSFVSPFYYPVDPVALNIPSYHSVIKKPMDLQTVQSKLHAGQYENAKEFEADIRLIFKNCFKFNLPGDPTYMAGQATENLFNEKWAGKADYLEAREPAPEYTSGSSSEGSDEGEDSEYDEDQLQQLRKQMGALNRQMEAIASKKKKTPPSGRRASKPKASKKEPKKRGSTSYAKKEKKPKSSRSEKGRFVTYHEKQMISNGIASLPDKKMQEALKIIQSNVPELKVCILIGDVNSANVFRVPKRPRLSLTLTSFPTMSCRCCSSL